MTGFKSGKQIYESLEGNSLIPPTLIQMIASGETTGKLGHILEKVSDYFDREVTIGIKTASSLIEPVMVIVMGLVIGVMALAMLPANLPTQRAFWVGRLTLQCSPEVRGIELVTEILRGLSLAFCCFFCFQLLPPASLLDIRLPLIQIICDDPKWYQWQNWYRNQEARIDEKRNPPPT